MPGYIENGKLTGTREPAAALDAHDSELTIFIRCLEARTLAMLDWSQHIRIYRKVYSVAELQTGRRIEVRQPGRR